MDYDKKLIGTRIMQRRKVCGYTQEQLAECIGLSKNHISTVERGKCLPTTSFIFKICEVLGETPDFYLIGKSNSKTDEITNLVKSLPLDKQEMLCLLLKTYIDNN
jgi:transcriptional regulator with XRE-family HTH domain